MSNNKNRKSAKRVKHLPSNIKGLPNNRWGGHKDSNLNAKGTFGPANKGRIVPPIEWKHLEEEYLKKSEECMKRDKSRWGSKPNWNIKPKKN